MIENQLRALDAVIDPRRPLNVALLYGGRCDDWPADLGETLSAVNLRLHEVPSLDYDDQNGDEQNGEGDLAEEVAGLLDGLGFLPTDTVVHVHNHSLGKNASLPDCLDRLASVGYPIVRQIHDFAEDLRPANYRRISHPGTLYPQAPQLHYAVLNGRDFEILSRAGVAPACLHLLPNPVPTMGNLPPREGARDKLERLFGVDHRQRYVFYPVRGIRRKNLGEALLLSALAPPDTVIGLALAPLNAAALPFYEEWKKLAKELRLPFLFEVGDSGGLGFTENLAAADAIVTTSLAEGFGMAFLESWLAGRPLLGRDLPEITADFAEAGVSFDWLYNRLDVPIDWVGEEAFEATVVDAYRRTLKAYDRVEPPDTVERLAAKVDAGRVDFGDLNEKFQRQVIRAVCSSDDRRREMLRDNPKLNEIMNIPKADVTATIERNGGAIDLQYALIPSGNRLRELYATVSASAGKTEPHELPHCEKILDRLLSPARFRMIRGV